MDSSSNSTSINSGGGNSKKLVIGVSNKNAGESFPAADGEKIKMTLLSSPGWKQRPLTLASATDGTSDNRNAHDNGNYDEENNWTVASRSEAPFPPSSVGSTSRSMIDDTTTTTSSSASGNSGSSVTPGAVAVVGQGARAGANERSRTIVTDDDVRLVAELTDDVSQRVKDQVEEVLGNLPDADVVTLMPMSRKIGYSCLNMAIAIVIAVLVTVSITKRQPKVDLEDVLTSLYYNDEDGEPIDIHVVEKVIDGRGDGGFIRSTPQFDAFQWLIEQDKVTNNLLKELEKKGVTDVNDGSIIQQQIIERFVLATVYFTTNGPKWRKSYSFLSTTESVCDWNEEALNKNETAEIIGGITCDISNNSIVAIDLCTNNNVRVVFDPKYPKLNLTIFVHSVSFHKICAAINNLNGTIPMELSFLTWNQELNLAANNLHGSIPKVLGHPQSRLTTLSLGLNELTGKIPDEIGSNLKELEGFSIYTNEMSGTIAKSLTMLPNLESLVLSTNQLEGTIPDFKPHSSMQYINIRENRLTGTIPWSTLSKLARLT